MPMKIEPHNQGPKCRVSHYVGWWLMDVAVLSPMVEKARNVDPLEAQRRFEERLRLQQEQEDKDRAAGKPVRRYQVVDDTIALFDVQGPTTKYETKMSDVFGLQSTLNLQRALRQAADDPAIKAGVWHADSPGGMLDGTTELVDDLRYFNSKKPLIVHGSDHLTSAAYLFGSQGRRLTVNRTCSVGSIGTKCTLINRSKQLEAQGLEAVSITTGKFKDAGDPLLPMDKAARQYYQERLNQVNDSFVNDVAYGRNMDPKKIRDMEARVYVAPEALQIGLVDGICSFDEALNYAKTNQIDEPKRGRLVTYSKPAPKTGATPRSISMLKPETIEKIRAMNIPGIAAVQDDALEDFMVQYNADTQRKITEFQTRQASGQLPVNPAQPAAPVQTPVAPVVPKADDPGLRRLADAAVREVESMERVGQLTPAQRDHVKGQLIVDGKPNPLMFTEQNGKYAYEVLLEGLKMTQGAQAPVEADGQSRTGAQQGNTRVHDPKKDDGRGNNTVQSAINRALTAHVASSFSPERQAERFAGRQGVVMPHAIQ